MRRSRTFVMAAAIVMAGMVALTLSPPQGTDAQWRDTATASVTGPKSDTFNMTATKVDFPAPEWSGVAGRVSNAPRINLKNESTHHSSWVNVQSTTLKKAVSPDSNTLLSNVALDYEIGDGQCTGTLGDYWKPGVSLPITEKKTYPRTQNKVAIATLGPGVTRSLCPAVRLAYATDTAVGQRQVLLNHGGRALDITTVVNQKSESPATWSSEPRTVTSQYRIAMPPPKKPSDVGDSSGVCRNTTQGGNPNGTGKTWGGFFWGWPDAGTNYDSPRPTPAMAGGWELFRKSATSEEWSSFHTDADNGALRNRAGFWASRINDDGLPRSTVRQFKLRGYPFATNGKPNKTRYVESDWIAQAHSDGAWYCDQTIPNPAPNAGPHNMP